MVNHVSNDEPSIDGENAEQRAARLARNTNRVNRRVQEAEEAERRAGRRPRDLADAFDRVSDRQVLQSPSANVAAAMTNLAQLPITPENEEIRQIMQAYLTAAVNQTTELARRAQVASIHRSRSASQARGNPTRIHDGDHYGVGAPGSGQDDDSHNGGGGNYRRDDRNLRDPHNDLR